MKLASSGAATSTFGYTGEQIDPKGMVYLRARYYAPSLSRFIQRDSIVLNPRVPEDWNRWAYTHDNPINHIDPNGHYNRDDAKTYAMTWERGSQDNPSIDPAFDFLANLDPAYNAPYIAGVMENRCTIFASSVLYTGGIRDTRGDPYTNGRQSDYTDPSYWDITVMMAKDWKTEKYSGKSWTSTPDFHQFVTRDEIGHSVLKYNYPPQRFKYGIRGGDGVDDPSSLGFKMLDWYRALNNAHDNIQKGDLVFYGRSEAPSDFYHVAVVVGWGSPTYFCSDVSVPDDLKKYFTCQPDYGFQNIVPEVVERSGAVNYTTSRSLDNTSAPVPYIEIVHINN